MTDLNASLAALDEQLGDLRAQRARIVTLISAAQGDGLLSPMPATIARFYERMAGHADDEKSRRMIRRERDFVELAFYRGDMPPESAVLYEGLSDAAYAAGLAKFRQVGGRSENSRLLSDRDLKRIADTVAEGFTERLGADLPRVAAAIDLDIARRAADLYVRLADPRDRRLDRAIADAVLAVIEKGHAP